MRKKIVTIVGARPQFIKLAALSSELRKHHDEIIIHTGQHYDYLMSDVFFEELGISKPDYNLRIQKNTHGSMTGEMLIRIEEKLMDLRPDMVILYGDTNSTLAGAIAASKLNIPVAHIEAGNRLGTLSNPEEINRKLTDHISTLLFCSTKSGVDFLEKESIKDGVHFVGDPMYDMFVKLTSNDSESIDEIEDLDSKCIKVPKEYVFLTIHRQENTDKISKLVNILDAAENSGYKIIYPVHPRVTKIISKILKTHNYKNIYFVKPLSYNRSIKLVNKAAKVITDSGGVQREAFFAEVPCVTIFDYVGWPETMVGNRNLLCKPKRNQILDRLNKKTEVLQSYKPFGDGKSFLKIIEVINEYFKSFEVNNKGDINET